MVKKLTLLLDSGCRPTTFFINDEDDKLCLEHFRKDMETLNIAEMPVDSSTVLYFFRSMEAYNLAHLHWITLQKFLCCTKNPVEENL